MKEKAPRGMTRRGFVSSLAIGWAAFSAAVVGGAAAMARFLFPNVVTEPPSTFNAGRPEEFAVGRVESRFKDEHRVWIVRNEEGIYALSAVCTHLGCAPNWLETERKFKCPCHGSGFYENGMNFEGPAPRPLERVKATLAEDGSVVVDKSRTFRWEARQWDQPDALLRLA